MNSLGQHAVSTDTSFIARLANIIPALIISTGIALVPNLPDVIVTIVRNVCSAFIVLTIALAIGSLLTLVNSIYERRPDARSEERRVGKEGRTQRATDTHTLKRKGARMRA